MIRILAIVCLTLLLASAAKADPPADKRQAELSQLREMLPSSKPFEAWLQKTGELPPDFDSLAVHPYAQDIFTTMRDGKPHRVTRDQWPQRRAEMREILEQWFVGHAPPAPKEVRAIIEEKTQDAGNERWQVRLEFGPNHAAILHCWLWMSPNLKKPAPVFLVDNFKYTRFARDALNKGTFAVCEYNAGDPAYIEYMPHYVKDRRDESDAYKDLFGNYDWSDFYRRGWSASRALDWLSTLEFIDAKRAYIGGHSRSAKQATVATAFDDRIAGLIASSPGAGGSLLFRDCDQYVYGESAELLSRNFPNWVIPKIRFFTGRENLLPGDMHFEYALIAPRPVLMSTAIHDDVENTWGVEHMYDIVQPVWQFLGAPGNIAVRYRPGPHAPDDETYHAHSKFLEGAAAGALPAEMFPYQPIHVWNYDRWLAQNPLMLDLAQLPDRTASTPAQDDVGQLLPREAWPPRRAAIRKQIDWLLGDGPAYEPIKPDFTAGETDEAAQRLTRAGHDHARLKFGEGINANLYRPAVAASDSRKFPAIIWLAPLHTATGYVPHYKEGEIPYTRWTKEGFIVLAYDPIATGDRQDERRIFYDRNPHWSLMGKMVRDARHAIDAAEAVPEVDPKQIYLVGFGMGAMTATLTAAMDDRIAGAVAVCGFTPFRTDTDSSPTGGLRRWSQLYGWLPRLGDFVGHESKTPVDFDEILAAAAPKPMLVIAPTLDWHANHADVERAVNSAAGVYRLLGTDHGIALESPARPCQFDDEMQASVLRWLKQSAGRRGE